MTQFVFRLDRFLKLRRHTERERAEALGAAVNAEEASKVDADAKAAHVATVTNSISTEPGAVSTAGAMRNLGLVLDAAIVQSDVANGELVDKQRETEQERERWGKARVDRKIIERLRERRLDAWASDTARAEQREMDETAARTRPIPGWST